MSDQVLLTKEGLEKIKEEFEYLITEKRTEIAERIKEARDFGDISENAEYDAAKDEQVAIEERINELELKIRHAVLINEEDISDERIVIGSKIKIKDMKHKEELALKIVGSTEADPLNNRISNESPVGRAVLGKKAGQTVEVLTPDGGIIKYKIIEIGSNVEV